MTFNEIVTKYGDVISCGVFLLLVLIMFRGIGHYKPTKKKAHAEIIRPSVIRITGNSESLIRHMNISGCTSKVHKGRNKWELHFSDTVKNYHLQDLVNEINERQT